MPTFREGDLTLELPDGVTPEQVMGAFNAMRAGATPVPPSPLRRMGERLEAGRITTREARAQAIEETTGAPLARSEGGELEELRDFGARFDIVGRSNLLSERLAKLSTDYPELETVVVDDPGGGQIVAIRSAGQEEFVLLDNDQFFTFADAADIAGSLLSVETLATIAATIASRGANLLPRIGAQVGGGALGRAGDIGIESARGFEHDPLDALLLDAGMAGAAAGLGELAVAPLRRGARALVGQGAIEMTPAQQAATQTAREAGIPTTPGMVQPLARRMEQQAAATSPRVQNFRIRQTAEALRDLRSLRDDPIAARIASGNLEGVTDAELVSVVNRVQQNMHALITGATATPEQAGRALREGRTAFVQAWRGLLKRRYDRALAAGADAEFDLSPAITRASEIRAGIRGRGRESKEIVDTGLLDAGGRPIVRETTKVPGIQLQKIDGELREIVNEILALDPRVQAFEGNTAFEQLKTLRTRLFDLKNATVDGKETNVNRLAGQLWDSLTQVMQNPAGGDARFRVLLQAANNANIRFERILEMADIARIARSDVDPGTLAPTLAQPGKAFTLRTLRRVLPEDKWERFVAGWRSDMLSKPEQIVARLDQWRGDPRGLRQLIGEAEENQLRIIGEQAQRFERGPIKRVLREQTRSADRIRTLVETGDAAELEQAIAAAGGRNSRFGRLMRAGMVQYVLDTAQVTRGAQEVLDPGLAIKAIERLRKNGLLEAVMTPDEARRLLDRRNLFSLLPARADPGASIMAAELASATAEVVTAPVHGRGAIVSFLRGITGVARNALVGRFFISDWGNRLMLGMGSRQVDMTTLRAAGAVGFQLLADLERDAREEEK